MQREISVYLDQAKAPGMGRRAAWAGPGHRVGAGEMAKRLAMVAEHRSEVVGREALSSSSARLASHSHQASQSQNNYLIIS